MTIVEQLAEVAAERDTLKAAIDTANATVAGLTEQMAAVQAELEAGRTAKEELTKAQAALVEQSVALAAAVEKAELMAKENANLTAKLAHAPAPYADVADGTKPVESATAPAEGRKIFTRAEISKMSRAEYSKNRQAILEQMAKGEIK